MILLPQTNTLEPLSLARPLALLIGVAVVAWGGLVWGRPGTIAAAIGTIVSLGNVWVLERLGARAMREVAGEPSAAEATDVASRLHVALGAKTIILLALVAFLANQGWSSLEMKPFAIGLLVSVFSLVAAGLIARGT